MGKFTKADSQEGLEDGYFDNLDNAGDGGPASAYMLRWLQRQAHYIYDLLFNLDPGELDRGRSSGNGHDHDGVNSRFIGKTIVAQEVAPFKGEEEITDLGWATELNDQPIGRVNNVALTYTSFDQNFDLLLPAIYVGPGVNAVRVWIMMIMANDVGGKWSRHQYGFKVENLSNGQSIETNLYWPENAVGEGSVEPTWQEITTYGMELPVQTEKENDLDIKIKALIEGNGTGYLANLIGIMIREVHV